MDNKTNRFDNDTGTSNETDPLISDNRFKMNKRGYIIAISISIVVTFVVAFVIGFFSSNRKQTIENPLNTYYSNLIKDVDNSLLSNLIDEIKADNIKEYLRDMTKVPHLGGTDGDYQSALYVRDKWVQQKLDFVNLSPYTVLLAYPDPNRLNSIEIRSASSVEVINITEPIYDKDLDYTNTPQPFLAFSENGTAASDEVYYANFCTDEDFEDLRSLNIDVTDAIVICKYGLIFRGDKVLIAERHGAKGVLLYDDPKRSAPISANGQTYPAGEWLPEDGTQRGTLYTGSGDPLTPLYPSIDNIYRIPENKTRGIPKIVAQVIGYKEAIRIFELIDQNVPVNSSTDWQGNMNVTYTYGGKLKDSKSFAINVYTEKKRVVTYNVIGVIEGEIEPDRYVMMGNHRDAWVFGSVDPTSGTATLLEISRALSTLRNTKGWKPKRSIVFLSWGSEEYGLIGSTEWVEEFNKKLSANGVAYLNTDISVQGNYSFTAKSSPLLWDLLYSVTRRVPLNDKQSVFDRWYEYAPNKNTGLPIISSQLGAGSDYMAFQQRVGLPSMDTRFNHDKSEKYRQIGSGYALYHTFYETFNLIEKYIDPGFNSFRVISVVMAEIARQLSDSLVLPFNCTKYSDEIHDMFAELYNDYGDLLNRTNISLIPLMRSMINFHQATLDFHNRLNSIDKTKIHLIRQYNDQMRNLEKAFLDPKGIDREGYMHMLSAPSLLNQYGGDGFPALNDAIIFAKNNSTEENWEKVRFEMSVVINAINQATTILDDSAKFERRLS